VGKWIGNWNCGFEDWDIGEVVKHEKEYWQNRKLLFGMSYV
jgi:hypothetical protein